MEKVVIKNEYLAVTVLALGATVNSIKFAGVELAAGFDNESDYEKSECYFGATVGRTANRCAGAGVIDGKRYALTLNENGINHLHGGKCGFDKKRFNIEAVSETSVTLSAASPDGEEGYPGGLKLFVTYKLTDDALLITYEAKTDKPTWVNLTNHTYFNPFGIASGKRINDMSVSVCADTVSVYDGHARIIGKKSVSGTPFDLNTLTPIERFYDHNFYLSGNNYRGFCGVDLKNAATLRGDVDIECYTDLPCMQLYCGEFIPENTRLANGVIIGKGSALCMEAQLEPNLQSRGEGILRPDEVYKAHIAYRFSANK